MRQTLIASLVLVSTSAFAYEVFGTKWGMGPNVATHLMGFAGTPGYVTWSIMGVDLPIIGFETHGGATTTAFGALLGTSAIDEEIAMITSVFDTWSAVSGITAVGPVSDGGSPGGAPEMLGAHLGDIRFGAIGGLAASELAHAWGPGTQAMFGIGGTIMGDLHINNTKTWVDDPDDPDGDSVYDLHTVVLHEVGHSLGLAHSDVSGAVMAPFYEGGKRTLTSDDVAGIEYLYGPVPEPGTFVAFGVGVVLYGTRRLRRRTD